MNIEIDGVNPRSCPVAVVSGTELLEMTSDELDELLKLKYIQLTYYH